MNRWIEQCRGSALSESLHLYEEVFTAWDSPEEGKMVWELVTQIRAGRYYVPELDLVMLQEGAGMVGAVLISRFPLEGRYDDVLLLLSPMAVRGPFQRQHISRDLIEHGFVLARSLGYRGVLAEGDPANYRARGFETSAKYGIVPSPNVHLPHPDCLMVCPLVPDGLARIHGQVDYGMYPALSV